MNILVTLCFWVLHISTHECSPVSQRESNWNIAWSMGPKMDIVRRSDCTNLDCGNNCVCELSHSSCQVCCTCEDCVKCHWGTGFADCCKKCFPSTATVTLGNGKHVAMSELKTGDKVQTVSSGGRIAVSSVRTFLKRQHSGVNLYKSIVTSMNNTIHLSENHLIHARKSGTDQFNPILADQVSIGDEVLVQENEALFPAKVVDMSSSRMQGAYVPLTMEGNIMVDGILASCYPSVDHDLSHIGMTPMRWFPEMTSWIFGEDNGAQAITNIAENIGRWVLPNEWSF